MVKIAIFKGIMEGVVKVVLNKMPDLEQIRHRIFICKILYLLFFCTAALLAATVLAGFTEALVFGVVVFWAESELLFLQHGIYTSCIVINAAI